MEKILPIYILYSKYNPPRNNDRNTNPIPVYINSDITIGLVFVLEILNLFFNIWDFTKLPASPGMNENANEEKYIKKLSLNGIWILEFFNNKFQRKKRRNQPKKINENIIGKNSVLKFDIFS